MIPHIAGIAGPSCSGKTELALWLSRHTGAPLLNLDHYYRPLDNEPLDVRAKHNFDVPAALDHEEIIRDVRYLAEGRVVRAPRYDFANHTRADGGDVIMPSRVVILEGLFALYWPELRNLIDTAIYVDASDEVCLERRLARDVKERGRTPESIRWQYETTVKPMAHLHIVPTRNHATLVVSGVDPVDISGRLALALLPP